MNIKYRLKDCILRNFFKLNNNGAHKLSAGKLFRFCFKALMIYFSLKVVVTQISFLSRHKIIYNKNNPLNEILIKSILPIDYKPTLYLPSCLMQMIYNEKQAKKPVEYQRQYVATHDLGVISLDWVVTENTKGNPLNYENLENDEKALIILHGLTGGSEANYIRDIIVEFSKIEKLKIVVVNYRGVSDSPLLTPYAYHFGDYTDLKTALEYIRERYPHLRTYALGTSMGANIFSNLLANCSEFNSYIKGFISVSNPFNAYEIEKRNRHGLLNYFLLKNKKEYLLKHKEAFEQIFDISKLMNFRLYRDLDEALTCRIYGFNSADEFYHKASCHSKLHKLKVPSIFFNSRDDKLSPIDSINMKTCNFFNFLLY